MLWLERKEAIVVKAVVTVCCMIGPVAVTVPPCPRFQTSVVASYCKTIDLVSAGPSTPRGSGVSVGRGGLPGIGVRRVSNSGICELIDSDVMLVGAANGKILTMGDAGVGVGVVPKPVSVIWK